MKPTNLHTRAKSNIFVSYSKSKNYPSAMFGRDEKNRVNGNKKDEWKYVRNKVKIKGIWLKKNRDEERDGNISGNSTVGPTIFKIISTSFLVL